MKRKFVMIPIGIAILAAILQITSGCDSNEPTILTQWRVTELEFESSKTYSSGFNDADVDVIFTHEDGEEMQIPAFWDGGKSWKVRFAPTLIGKWKYATLCTDEQNSGLHNQTGKLICAEYTGDLELYQRGFVNINTPNRYFTYNDGTPFFYIGDTHWNMPENSLENFKTIIDKRVEQGFTVIQSEPIRAGYDLKDGLTDSDIFFFKKMDERFKYIADKGFVHANSQLFFVSELGQNMSKYPDEYLEKLSRFWVARYGAYPVMWTTAQECDNDFYKDRGDHNYYDADTNPWKKVAALVHQYDAYNHPLTAHMEHTSFTIASQSSFRDVEGHNWYATQWSPNKNGQLNFDVPKDFWYKGQGKPIVSFEGLYDHLWTKHFGARMQGWTAFLNGMYGHGYGAIDIWLYNSWYNMDVPTVRDGITISVVDKQKKWHESVEFPSAYQMGYMHNFFSNIEWWKLIPRFDDAYWFSNNGSWYSLASIEDKLIVAYFYNNINRNTGTIKHLVNSDYTLQWFNPITGEYQAETTVAITDGTYNIGLKPDKNDWVLLMKKK